MLLINPSTLLFSSTLITGMIIAISSPSWFTSWIGLELNLLSFIPLIFSKQNTFSSEAALKYFLVQAMGSAVLLAAASTLLIMTNSSKVIILSALLLKMGAAPLHFWLPPIMQGISWSRCIILMTIQKIAPMAMVTYTLSPSTLLIISSSSMISAILGGLGGLNQTMMRKIMAYSSISHMGWLLAAISLNSTIWMNYLLIYSIISASLAIMMDQNQLFHIKQLMSVSYSQVSKITVFLSLFSLGGLPPFLGFLPKLSVIKELTAQTSILWVSVLTMSALITLFFYTRISITALTLKSPKMLTLSSSQSQKMALFSLINLTPILYPLAVMIQF
ncbi:NADH dehydrogenase subunit 2 (mitochondrion) [Macrobrachium nipponense]|uniref:NADH-ubiquinone oxidoreductase chain 2 n=1 Tax=Macrobrachium nipponense TaxID=159736 RepID=E7EL64_MACNP|nr:NADH dehydrogenase subunit 2 [Macrobrachium nipponense]ADV30215.1 NADH dehydrogenase subunit 2 [Macrobrachium nipponense]UVU21231.1 NADH dehydrogenase subunit 2 [Macrobrachium nipponense]